MAGGWWNVSLLIVAVVVGLALWNCQASDGTNSCSRPNITRLNFKYFVSILNGTSRTLSSEIRSDTPLKEEPIWTREYPPSLPEGHSVVNFLCSFSTNKTCIVSNLTLIHVVRGHYEGNYTLTAENDCGKASVYVEVNIIVPEKCESDYNNPPKLQTPPPLVVQAVQGESITIKAEYKGNINDPNLLAYWCVTTLDGNRCIFPTDNDTSYNVTTIRNCLPTDPDCCYFNVSIKIKSLTLGLSQAILTSAAVWLQNPTVFNPGNSTLIVNVLPTLDKWVPSSSVEVHEGHSTKFTCIYNASTNPNITITTWKFEEEYLQHNSAHYTMTTKYGTDPANANHVLSKIQLSNVALDNAGTYSCQCVYNRSTIYSKHTFDSETKSFHLKVKSGHMLYVIIGVPLTVLVMVLIVIFLVIFLIRRRRKKSNTLRRSSKHTSEADQTVGENAHNIGHKIGQNDNNNGENDQNINDSDQNSSNDEHAPLLTKNDHHAQSMKQFPPDDIENSATGMSAKCYGTIDGDDTSRQVNIPEEKPKRQDSGTAKPTYQAKCEDQLISEQECDDVPKRDLTPNHQMINCQNDETMTGTINANTPAAISATYSIHANATVNFNQSSTPYGNDHPPTTDPDANGDRDATHSTELPTKPLLHDILPTDQSVDSEREGSGRPKPAASSGGNVTYTNKPTTELLNDLFKEIPLDCDWYRLGESLLNEAVGRRLDTIKKNNPDNAEKCCDEMLLYWCDSCTAVTWSKMRGALENIKQDEPVQMIKSDDSIKGTDKPSHQLLHKYVRDKTAPKWRDLGMHLLKEDAVCQLNIIKANHPDDVQACCSKMFERWLDTDIEANWNTLIAALEQMGLNALAAKIKNDILKGYEQALPDASGIPATDVPSTNNYVNHSVTLEPCTKDERNEAPEPPKKPSLIRTSTDKPIESESEMPIKLQPAKWAESTLEKDKTKSSANEPESRPYTYAAPVAKKITTASVLDYKGILNSIAPDLLDINVNSLLPYLLKHRLVTRDEQYHLNNNNLSFDTRSQMLLQYLSCKGHGSLQKFLCCLNLEHNHMAHEGIADKLKKAMQANGIDCDDFCSDCCKNR